MGEKFRVKGSVYEVNLQYHSKIEGYTTLMSDILELGDIASLNKRGD
uniref:Uncharacterized protein n=1 Tax=Candidatus Methanophagaceae archaeon ANME-1 ERB6 TaxID=2759912 RepID=A0A7G9YUB7_9EURY|nr:hypothetical protein FJOHDBIG_00050 [Methanosarcinales archaeon ANME-1 ERB6]